MEYQNENEREDEISNRRAKEGKKRVKCIDRNLHARMYGSEHKTSMDLIENTHLKQEKIQNIVSKQNMSSTNISYYICCC